MWKTLTAASILLIASTATARTIYVDNQIGVDVNDGTSPTITGLQSGPVRTLRRAQVLVRPGDVIEIANTGVPYYDSLRLVGSQASGVPSQPTVVNGNGAIFDGSDPVTAEQWQPLGKGLWRLDPLQKGWYQLVRDDVPVPETPAAYEGGRPSPPPGHWSAWRGSLYYQALPDELPANELFRIATREAGVFLYGVRYIVVRNLTVRHFRLDGVNVHDQADYVVLENIVSENNGRSGIFVGGSSRVRILGGATQSNREASLLLKEKGTVDLHEMQLDAEPVVAE